MQSDFAEGFVNAMLGWMRSLAAAVANMFRSGQNAQSGGSSFIEWFKGNWIGLLIALVVIGVITDLAVWLLRWRPYWLWFKMPRIVPDGDTDLDSPYEPKDRFHSRVLRYEDEEYNGYEDGEYEEIYDTDDDGYYEEPDEYERIYEADDEEYDEDPDEYEDIYGTDDGDDDYDEDPDEYEKIYGDDGDGEPNKDGLTKADVWEPELVDVDVHKGILPEKETGGWEKSDDNDVLDAIEASLDDDKPDDDGGIIDFGDEFNAPAENAREADKADVPAQSGDIILSDDYDEADFDESSQSRKARRNRREANRDGDF